jgi:hypothetical protein
MAEYDLTPEQKKEVLKYGGQDPIDKEENYRLNTKESAKGFRYYEWTVRGETLAELAKRDGEIRQYIVERRKEDAKDAKGSIREE